METETRLLWTEQKLFLVRPVAHLGLVKPDCGPKQPCQGLPLMAKGRCFVGITNHETLVCMILSGFKGDDRMTDLVSKTVEFLAVFISKLSGVLFVRGEACSEFGHV